MELSALGYELARVRNLGIRRELDRHGIRHLREGLVGGGVISPLSERDHIGSVALDTISGLTAGCLASWFSFPTVAVGQVIRSGGTLNYMGTVVSGKRAIMRLSLRYLPSEATALTHPGENA